MKPDLFKYLDYRHYLKDFYQAQKTVKGSQFSFRSFSRLAGLSSPNFLKLVMEGQRNLGPDGIEQFSKGLKLNREEALFFKNLVHFNQAKTDKERNTWYQRLSADKRYQEIRELEKEQYIYYSRWYFAAIREMTLFPEFREDPAWIAQKLSPPIKSKEAEEALELLQKLGFLKRNQSGRLVPSERNITTSREVVDLAVANFHRQMIEGAARSIEKTPPHERDISSLTVAVSKEKFEEAKKRIQDFRRELNILLSDDDRADSVYQINFQIFNLSEVPWS